MIADFFKGLCYTVLGYILPERTREMEKELLFRKDVDKKLTWDLSLIYPTEEKMQEDFNRTKEMVETI